MITRSIRLIHFYLAAIFLLMAISGCAQTRSAIKDDAPVAAGNSGSAVIQGIKVSSDASQIEVQTSRPLSYTYYRNIDPQKIVIDISQTDPGSSVGSLEVNAGNIKKIVVAKHEFTGGFLSRIEILPLKELGDFSITTDAADKGKLLVTFAKMPKEENPAASVKEESKPSDVAEKGNGAKEPQLQAGSAAANDQIQTPAAGVVPTASAVQEEKRVAGDNGADAKPVNEPKASKPLQPQVLSAIAADDEGIKISVGGGVATYNAFKLNKPDRIVLDLPGLKNGITAKSVAINKFGVGQARLGNYAGKVRIVFDTVKGSLPPYHIMKIDEGLKVVLAESPAKSAAKEPAKETTALPVAAGNPEVASAQDRKLLTTVAVADDGIEINISGGIDTFSVFKLTKPDRIVLDLPEVKSGISAKQIALNKFGVGQARLGSYPGKVRIVLDAAKDVIPSHQVIKDAKGLKVVFAEASAKSPDKTDKEPAKEAVAPAAPEKAVKPGSSAIEAIDFRIVGEYSQIALKLGGDCKVGKISQVANGQALTIHNCKVPVKLQRTIDAGAFPGVVQKIIPYQVRVKKGSEARILVKLRQPAANSALRTEGDSVLWEIKNPEATTVAAATARQARQVRDNTVDSSEASPIPERRDKIITAKAAESEIARNAAYRPGEKKIYTGRRVSLEFSDADIRKILQLIAEVSNLNFIIGDDVTGTISIKLVNVPWDQALDVILETKGLEKRQDGNIMYIKPKGKFVSEDQIEAEAKRERERRMELKTQVFEINFASVSDIASQFEKLKSDRGNISKDERTNRVIVTDVDERIEKMRRLLKELDLPEKQVMIEARIVEATSTFSRDLGVQWGLHYKDGSASFMGINNVDLGLGGIVIPPPSSGTFSATSATTTGGAAGISFGKLNSNIQLDLRLSAAAAIGQVKVISTPKVVTLNNKAAKISQGQSIPYQTTSAEGTKTEFVEAALTLEVTPHVANDGSISMKIKASNNSPGEGTPPPINKKEATTEVQVMTGETTVIGGIYQDTDTENDTGVPFLQDIPLLGWLFKSNKKSKTKTELLIFITPKIVS